MNPHLLSWSAWTTRDSCVLPSCHHLHVQGYLVSIHVYLLHVIHIKCDVHAPKLIKVIYIEHPFLSTLEIVRQKCQLHSCRHSRLHHSSLDVDHPCRHISPSFEIDNLDQVEISSHWLSVHFTFLSLDEKTSSPMKRIWRLARKRCISLLEVFISFQGEETP